MVKKLVKKAQFARLAGVSAAAITKACGAKLKPAMIGRRIDAGHPNALAYLQSQADPEQRGVATGIDELYEEAVQHCRATGRFTASSISRGLGTGYARAARIFAMMAAAGVSGPAAPSTRPAVTAAAPPPPKPPAVKPRGPKLPTVTGMAKLRQVKKQESLDRLNAEQATAPAETGSMLHEIPEDILAFADMTLRELTQRHGTDVAFLDWLKATKQIEDINEKRLKNAVTKGELVSRELVKIGVLDQINAAHMKLLTDGAKTIATRVTAMASAGRSVGECEKFIVDQISSFIKPAKVKMTRALKNA